VKVDLESRNKRSSYDPASIQGKDDLDMKNKVLVAGASGLIGVAAIEAFLSAGWEVIGISRRKPDLPSGRNFTFISVDLRDGNAARVALSRTWRMRRFTKMPAIW
jgi:NAD(P)-dependent dehydrogenase (short-subunit alcohol dehydrogenase family)